MASSQVAIAEGFNELILVFDSLKPNSFKKKLERDTNKAKLLLQYSTTLKMTQTPNIPLTQFLSHKADLLVYLAQATLKCKIRLPTAIYHISIKTNKD